MARMKTISAIETELAKVMTSLDKAQKRVDCLSAKAVNLQKQKQDYEFKQIMDESGKTFEELMTFLSVREDSGAGKVTLVRNP